MRTSAFLKGGAAFAIVAGAFLGCAWLPPTLPPPTAMLRAPSSACLDTAGTALGTAIAPLAAAHPGLAGIHPLIDGRDAFAARALLAARAERSLDVQYYIWRKDLTGTLLLESLRAAAARGVRVRLLLDDNNTDGLDPALLALDRAPNVEVRLFNPFAMRSWRSLGYLTEFARLNRRMHNKSFTADNQATIVGGRNVGDEYFGAADDVLFVDLDVLAVGPVVQDVSRDFDRYWNSGSAYPVAALVDAGQADAPDALPRQAALLRTRPEARGYLDALRSAPFVAQLAQRRLALEWGVARLVSDDPAKVLGTAPAWAHMAPRLRALLGEPRRRLDIVSPYFVPGEETTRTLVAMARGGVQVRVLTNSLHATDVAAVHAGYARWRRALLEGGVALYELKRMGDGDAQQRRIGGSSSSSLHAKTFGVDGQRIFVGSFNLDPRSIALNTEMGLVIDSPALAGRLDDTLAQSMPAQAYAVRLGEDGELAWIERTGGGAVRHAEEPGTNAWKRAGVRVLSWLPIDWLL
ncbi:phospholipase D family protein [uncultured Massilia sp.]|uniref:phospholipase D family protein n=1 Tax=uncultured Massilia sp. TaxID=169973 RepID=UPI0025EC7B54|nr:phospholipase D family protein [uncultured Massilia sp.]